MALIEVNHKTLKEVAEAIDTYCETQDSEMKKAKSAVSNMLLKDWVGDDATAFQNKWNEVDSDGSVTTQFSKMLSNYAECLRANAELYRQAQEDSYNEATRLPRWW